MSTTVASTFQFKRGTEARWEEVNPILKQGEPGFVYDKNKLKIGDGITPWRDLPYVEDETIDAMDATFADTNAGVVTGLVQTDGKITSVIQRKVNFADLDDTDVFVFYCGNATGYAADKGNDQFKMTLDEGALDNVILV